MVSQKVLLLAHDAHFGTHEMLRSIPKSRPKVLRRSMCMSFFVMPYTFTVVGRFKMVQSNVHLSSIVPVHLHLFETPPNGPLFWAFDKKRHTHAP
jgi:hypothetical protein